MTFFETPPERPRRRSSGAAWLLTAVVAGGVAAGATGPLGSLLPWTDQDVPTPPFAVTGDPDLPGDIAPVLPAWEPTPDVAALLPQMSLTDAGRALFLSTRPELVDVGGVRRLCENAGDTPDAGWHVAGCYFGQGRIAILRPADPRLAERAVTTAVHELLHAAYASLDAVEQADVGRMLEAAAASLPADAPVHASIAASVGDDPRSLATERFAYLGSQLRHVPDWDPALENVYARWIADRGAVVDVHDRAQAVVPDATAAVQQRWAEVTGREQAEAGEDAQLAAEEGAYAQAWADYAPDRQRFDAMPPAERALYTATRTYADGRVEQMPWEQSLITRRGELDARRAELDARATDLTARRAETARLRLDAEAAAADLDALLRAAESS
ncbi:hypothetical protein [Microbacterium rhizophilus]|uniref:hypothetical protein n=1 Tax=Microbacterium rhizophilus TaxID=3138934 RepID=UPI0031E59C05